MITKVFTEMLKGMITGMITKMIMGMTLGLLRLVLMKCINVHLKTLGDDAGLIAFRFTDAVLMLT